MNNPFGTSLPQVVLDLFGYTRVRLDERWETIRSRDKPVVREATSMWSTELTSVLNYT
jgi:hypothetical protein